LLSPRLRLGKMLMKSVFQKNAGFTGFLRFFTPRMSKQRKATRAFYKRERAQTDALLILRQSNKT
jgi:hypothetical protein